MKLSKKTRKKILRLITSNEDLQKLVRKEFPDSYRDLKQHNINHSVVSRLGVTQEMLDEFVEL